MNQPNLILQMIQSLRTKAEAYRDAFPPGSVPDRESPLYTDLMQTLKATNASLKTIDAELDDQLKAKISSMSAKLEAAKEQVAKKAAKEADQRKQRAAAASADLSKVKKPGLPTFPFEKAYAPSTARLQHLITRFSQIGHSTMVKHASQQTNRFPEQPRA